MNKKIMIAAAMSVPVLLAQSVSAIAAPQGPSWASAEDVPAAFMAAEDANGDGKVTQDEFKGPDADFAQFDKNGDGVIELSEAPTSGPGAEMPMDPNLNMLDKVTINGVEFAFETKYAFFGWDELPAELELDRQAVNSFTSPDGVTHYYEFVFVPGGNLNWYQAAYLAADAGGYLASVTSAEENTFLFNQVDDSKFFWSFPAYVEGVSQANHYEISIGPFLGGYQPEGSEEPAGGWSWLSGEDWTYSNWAQNLDDGVTDKDPRNNTQPNDSGDNTNQRVMGFGEMNLPVPTWGDYMDAVGTYGVSKTPGSSYGFFIEYEAKP